MLKTKFIHEICLIVIKVRRVFMKIGYSSNKYPEKRCIVGKVSSVEYVDCTEKII